MFTFLGPRPLRLLVVDDDEIDRKRILRELRAVAPTVEVTEVGQAPDALTQLRAGEFDCAVFDLYMPPRDGLWLLREARAAGVTTPVVMLTGQGDEQSAVALMKAGAADYIPKAALSATRLAQSIRHAILLHRAEQQAQRSEGALRTGEERLRIALRAADMGIWDLDPQAGTLEWDERSKELFGLSGDAPVDYGVFLAGLHPEDRERVHAAQQRALSGDDDGDYAAEYRTVGPDGAERWVSAQGRVLFDDARKPIRFIGTMLDVSERKRSEQERSRLLDAERQARAAAEAASRTRDELIAVVSHDLRNPLGTIVTSAQLLQRLDIDNARLARQLEAILRSARTMERLISDLLDLASIDAHSLPVALAPCEAGAILQEAAQLFGPLVEAKGLRFVYDSAGAPLTAQCDRDRILQVLSNLVGNAIKFTERGSISLGARALDGGGVLISVADTGAGIAAEHLPHIFDRYFQVGSGGRQGVGLGLSIAKGIIEAHGGRVWAESAPGAGTTIFFTLPRAVPGDAAAARSDGDRQSPPPHAV
jgi:PAS domain S-box-containing protein